jgi:hypothetical protein
VGLLLEGLNGAAERKNGWQLAECVGDPAPWRMQALLGRTLWDQEKARDICRDYLIERFGDPAGVLSMLAGAGVSRRLARPVERSANPPHLRQSEQNEAIRRSLRECVKLAAVSVRQSRRLLSHLTAARLPDLRLLWNCSI